MALITLNGAGVLDGSSIYSPKSGAWHAELRVDTSDSITGACEISISDGALVLEGTADLSGNFADTGYVRVVGGAGGLGTLTKPKFYSNATLRIVLGDLVAAAGEKLSSTADQATLARALTSWTTTQRPTGSVIGLLLQQAAGASWRILPDGSLWVGPETWPDSGIDATTYQILDELPSDGTAELGMESPVLLAGQSLAGRHVSQVEHRLQGDGVRSTAWFEP